MNFDEARRLATARFQEIHARELLPDWFYAASTVSGSHAAPNVWNVYVTLTPRIVLKANEAWEVRNGNKVLTRTSALTGKKSIVIHYDEGEPAVVFQASVNGDTGLVDVVIDTDISKLDKTKFEY